jgi:hypothetical protein
VQRVASATLLACGGEVAHLGDLGCLFDLEDEEALLLGWSDLDLTL